MSLALKRSSINSCRQRTYSVVPKATLVVAANQAFKPYPPAGSAVRQRTGSYVKWNATADDFFKVLACLEAASLLPPLAHSNATGAPKASAPKQKAWAGIVNGLFARSAKQQTAELPDMSLSLDDGTPLSHAVVMFTATWCGPCSVVYRELRLAAGRLQGRPPTAILMVDVEEEKELASQLGIKALPTVLYLGPDASRGPIFTQGPVSASFILDTLDRALEFGGRDVQSKWLKL